MKQMDVGRVNYRYIYTRPSPPLFRRARRKYSEIIIRDREESVYVKCCKILGGFTNAIDLSFNTYAPKYLYAPYGTYTSQIQ